MLRQDAPRSLAPWSALLLAPCGACAFALPRGDNRIRAGLADFGSDALRIPVPLSRIESRTSAPRFSTPMSTRLASSVTNHIGERASRATW